MTPNDLDASSSPHAFLSSKTNGTPKRYGLIAAWGRYPVLLARALKKAGHEVVCLGVVNLADPELEKICDVFRWSGLAKFGSATKFFIRQGVTEATLAGKIHKQKLFAPWYVYRQIPDWYTLRTFAPHVLLGSRDCRDDSLLLTVVNAFERRGVKLLPGTDLAPELLVKRQKLTNKGPTAAQWKDICFGWQLAREMGRLDVGQSVAVKNQAVLAVEAMEGTDEMIRRSGLLCKKSGFTVIKVSKPRQDMRFDVPTFGPGTIKTMNESGAKVLAVEAGKTIFIDEEEVLDYANRHGIVIVAILEEDTRQPVTPFEELPVAPEACSITARTETATK